MNNCLDDFAAGLNKSLPNAASQQNVYASAWIGKLVPSAPAHFALGLEGGVVKLDTKPLSRLAGVFGVGKLPDSFIYPTITANARIGGLFLPFDLGFSCMYMDFSNLKSVCDGFGIQFFNIGGDMRWAILKGEGAAPQVSVGAGYYYIGGKVSLDKDGLSAGIDYSTHTLFGQVQVSKTLLFFTPYIGFRGIFSKSAADWKWSITSERKAAAASYVGAETSGKGSAKNDWTGNFIPQIYGGFGFNFGFFALNLAGSFDFAHSIWGADMSLRFQI